jgi:ketosteroid isomerase-like protein
MPESTPVSSSPLEQPTPWDDAPLFDETRALFRCVRDHDFETLAELCDDDFGIVDLDPEGQSVMIRTRAEWEDWFHTLFARLDAMDAHTDTEILAYDVLPGRDLAMSVVEFCQLLTVGGAAHRFYCVVTIVWKQVDGRWKEARWHVSLLRRGDADDETA